MGRGGNNQALNEARQLLFGPRLGRPLPAAAKKRLAAQKRSDDLRVNKDKYLQSFYDAYQEITEGDGSKLADLLREPAGHGFKGIEKQQIGKLATSLNKSVRDAMRAKDDDIEPLQRDEDIEGLVLLYDRCKERGLSQGKIWEAYHGAGEYAAGRANARVREQLVNNASMIGPLPKVMHGHDFCDHIDIGDETSLCGNQTPYSYNPQYVDNFEHSVASVPVSCADCLAAYAVEKGRVDHLSESEWTAMLKDLNENNWTDIFDNGRQIITDGDSSNALDRGLELIDDYYKGLIDPFNEMITPYTSFRLR